MAPITNAPAIARLHALQRVSLAHLPTPLEPLQRLSARLGGPRLWVKRDDCTGLATGGNKTRKIELLLADALEKKTDTIVTVGAVQSNHARQVAAASARYGLRCVLGLLDAVPGRSDVYRTLGNVGLDRLLGAEIRFLADLPDTASWLETTASELVRQGRHPYVIPLGGSNGLGAAAYALAFLEVLTQFETSGVAPEAVIVPIVSGGTMAGLLLGAALSGWGGTILGVSAGDPAARAVDRVRAPLLAAAELLGLPGETIGETPVRIDDRFIGEGYGIPTPEGARALELLARHEGLLLDPVYTGKAMAGLIALVREGHFGANVRDVLFWHTGGSVALHAYPEIIAHSKPREAVAHDD